MCNDSAVQWSDYESHRRNLESETRQTICSQLQRLVEIAYDSGDSQCFIQGIERAHDFIRNGMTSVVDTSGDNSENRLF